LTTTEKSVRLCLMNIPRSICLTEAKRESPLDAAPQRKPLTPCDPAPEPQADLPTRQFRPLSALQIRRPELKLPNASFRFVKGASDLMSGLTFRVADVAKVRDAAKAKGCPVSGDGFDLCGVRFELTT